MATAKTTRERPRLIKNKITNTEEIMTIDLFVGLHIVFKDKKGTTTAQVEDTQKDPTVVDITSTTLDIDTSLIEEDAKAIAQAGVNALEADLAKARSIIEAVLRKYPKL